MSSPPTITSRPVRVSYDADADALHVCEFGTVPEERMEDQVVDLGGGLRFFLRRPGGPVIGFRIAGLHDLDPDGHEPGLWGAPRFRAPTLGLRRASIGEIALRARSCFGGRSTADVAAFVHATERMGERDYAGAHEAFRDALDAGELRAHLGIAGVQCGQGRYAAAYDHARIFTELARRNSWAWTWLGRVCVELGEVAEAQAALRRAVRLEREGSYRTPARKVLHSLAER